MAKYDGLNCPVCGHSIRVEDVMSDGADRIQQDVVCDHCNRKFTEIYALVEMRERNDSGDVIATYPVSE